MEIYKRKDVNNEMAREVDTKGYVKAYRKMQDTEVFKSPYAVQLFLYCLFNAKFSGKDAGTFVTTQDKIRKDLGWSRPTVIKFMKFLKEINCIDYQGSNTDTKIKVINFQYYQGK
ncbi:hypothetical protein [Faecalibacillus intestinalis]|uniref:hypothetical protein n=2 Tax=Faecalibacillus intestinalis TaxID=1982626 RepID=UPI00399F99DD